MASPKGGGSLTSRPKGSSAPQTRNQSGLLSRLSRLMRNNKGYFRPGAVMGNSTGAKNSKAVTVRKAGAVERLVRKGISNVNKALESKKKSPLKSVLNALGIKRIKQLDVPGVSKPKTPAARMGSGSTRDKGERDKAFNPYRDV